MFDLRDIFQERNPGVKRELPVLGQLGHIIHFLLNVANIESHTEQVATMQPSRIIGVAHISCLYKIILW